MDLARVLACAECHDEQTIPCAGILNNGLSLYARSPSNPLNLTASCSLRFSLDFMHAFTDAKEPGMTFSGVAYENAKRAEIIHQLLNAVDI